MKSMVPFFTNGLIIACALLQIPVAVAAEEPSATLPHTQTFVKTYCIDCHRGGEPEGDVSLENLQIVTRNNAKLWQRVFTQVSIGEMPPDGEEQPKLAEREAVIEWIGDSMTAAGIALKRPYGNLPQDGNLVDHDRLFSGKFTGPASSPPRFWRKSQPRYDALMEQLWVIPKLRYEKDHTRVDPHWAGYGYSRPFPALDPENFTNYASSVYADEAVLRALMEAGGQIAERLTAEKLTYDKMVQPPHAVGIPSVRRGSEWERFLVEPPARPAEYEPFLVKNPKPSVSQQQAAIQRTFQIVLNRKATPEERERYGGLLQRSLDKRGASAALKGLITAVVVSPEFVFRMEVGLGEKDEHGRRMLSPRELVYAISDALTDAGPDEQLWEAANTGRLKTRGDVEREVRRILSDDTIEKQPRLRFFQEFFGYHHAVEVFKDEPGWKHEVQYLVRDADLLVEQALKKDRHVLAELLTTDRYFVAFPVIHNPELFEAIIEHTRKLTLQSIEKQKQRGREIKPNRQGRYDRNWALTQGRELIPRTVHNDRGSAEMSYIRIYGIDGTTFNWTRDQPIKVPGRRAGLLTHPAWLVAHSTNSDNDIVGRGHWIREHLLAGKIPDVPLDVEAQVPEEPEHTLRHRMRVTRAARCIRCHQRMDPLGFPFEMYDHLGRYRTKELVGPRKKKALPLDVTGAIIASGEESLNGPVTDAIDLVHRLSKSPRVRQSFVRHAFRYWMGRNETLHDSPTLIAADQAYVDSEGSFQELLVSLLTSDSFLYRK